MIDRFEKTLALLFYYFLNLLLRAIDDLFDLHLFFENRVGPIDARGVRAVVQTQMRVVACKFGDGERVLIAQQ